MQPIEFIDARDRGKASGIGSLGPACIKGPFFFFLLFFVNSFYFYRLQRFLPSEIKNYRLTQKCWGGIYPPYPPGRCAPGRRS